MVDVRTSQPNREIDRMDPEARLGWGERIGYGVSNFGVSMLFVPLTSFLLIYLTNVAFLDIAAVSVIIAVSKVLDGISDLVVGHIIDRTTSPLGKGRIWLLRMCLPFAVSALLLFWVPSSLPSAVKYIYVFILYNLASTVCFTFMAISGFSMVPLITGNRKEQGILSCSQAVFGSMGAMVAASGFVLILSRFSGSADNPQTQRGYTMTIGLLCVVMVVSALITVATTRERVKVGLPGGERKAAEKPSLRAVARALLHSKYWVFIFFIALGHNLLGQLSVNGLTYYATYVMNDLEAVGLLNILQLPPSILVEVAVLFMMKRVNKSLLFGCGLLSMAVGNLGFGLTASTQVGMIVFTVIKGIGMGLIQAMILGLVADTIHYTHRKSGVFTAGMGNAGISASQKIGMGLAAALFGFLMKAAGFSALNELQHLPQPDSVANATVWGFAWIPGIGYTILFILFACIYRLEREMDGEPGGTEEIAPE